MDKSTDVLPESEKTLGDQKNMGFMSTLVVKGTVKYSCLLIICKGRGVGVVVSTGTETEIGEEN